ncbi:hypothetical protein BGW37DRAFT_257850 [Umbelopsis sp. PMI_123]|nr:hypothetical protein BGW37DRAFT_257850 [Umbelopsis sp. PMI_123]
MPDTVTLYKKEDYHEIMVPCFRTDFSDDAKWKYLLELADDPSEEFKATDFLVIVEGRQYENKTAQELLSISPDTYVIADMQSMEDETFHLVHHDYIYEENEAGQFDLVGRELKTARYPARKIWAPISNLPIANMGWEDFAPDQL